jgi:hypothetical protein
VPELVFFVTGFVALQKLINQGLFAIAALRYNPVAFLSALTVWICKLSSSDADFSV